MTDYQFKLQVKGAVQDHGSQKVADTLGVTKQTVDAWAQGRNLAHPVMRDAVVASLAYVNRPKMHVPKA